MPDLQSFKLPKAARTYFFDIAKTTGKDHYIRISCAEKHRTGFEHHRLFIFEGDLTAFIATLKKAAEELEKLKGHKVQRAGSKS